MPDRTILLRCLSGEASPEEAALLDSWLNASPENRQEFDALWSVWQKTGNKTYIAPDIGSEWQALQSRILPAPTPGPTKAIYGHGKTAFRFGGWKVFAGLILGGALITVVAVRIGRHSKKGSMDQVQEQQKDRAETASAGQTLSESVVLRQSNGNVVRDSLRDGVIITLGEQSVLYYPSTQTNKQRPDTISLIRGSVYLQTTGRPVAVLAGDLAIGGGPANYLVTKDSATGSIGIQVFQGRLDVKSNTADLVLSAGHSLQYEREGNVLSEKSRVDTNSASFATGIYSFTNTPLKELIAVLAKGYHFHFRLANPTIGQCRMTVQFDNLPLEDVLGIIATTLNIHYSMRDGIIDLNGAGCD